MSNKLKNESLNIQDENLKRQRIEALEKGKIYLDNCLKGFFINNYNKFFNIEKPIITVIIPIYNCEKTITSSIRSIQNQNFLDIEIILVNDFSKDNSTKVIMQLKKEDSRISIINNSKNMGTFYSRCIGTLLSKGEYIFALDNDDMIFDNNVFEFIYNIAKNENIDVVGFKSIFTNEFYNYDISQMIDNPLPNYSNNITIYQPELEDSLISTLGNFKDINIWGKIIKNNIYKKGINYLGIERYLHFISWAEDSCMVFIIHKVAQSYKFVNKYGIIHFNSFKTASHTQSYNIKYFGLLFLLDIIFDFSKNNANKNSAVYFALYLKNHFNIKSFGGKNLLYLKYILKKIINCKYINKINKEKLKINFIEFLN